MADAGAFIHAETEKIEIGTILRITPQVGQRGELTLNMNIEVSVFLSCDERNLLVVSRRTMHSVIQIQSCGTAAIAGLTDTRAQFGRSCIRGTANVPLLCRGFRIDIPTDIAAGNLAEALGRVVFSPDFLFENRPTIRNAPVASATSRSATRR